jgi:hypothetical protein
MGNAVERLALPPDRRWFQARIRQHDFGTQDERPGAAAWNCSLIHFFDQMRLWSRAAEGRSSRTNLLTLSEPFWSELNAHPIPVDCEVVRALANNPGCLDLYTWLRWRRLQAKGPERAPLFGPCG